MYKTFSQFYKFLNENKKNKLKFIFFITSLSFILEFVSISSIPIYFSLVTEQGSSLENFEKLFSFFNFNYEINNENIISLGLVVVLIFLIKNLILFYLLIYENKFYKNVKNRLSEKLYSDFVHSDYEKLLNFNPSNISRTTVSSVNDAFLYLQSLLGIYKESLAILAIFLIVLIVNPVTVILIFTLFSIISLAYYKFLRPFLHNAGQKNQIILSKLIKLLNETFGSIKELRILNKETKIKEDFLSDIFVYNKNFFYFTIIQKLPKIILEVIFLTALMLTTIFFLSKNQNFLIIIPEIALYTLVSLRFIPAFNSMSSNFTYLKIGEASINTIFNDFKKLNNKNEFRNDLKEEFNKNSDSLKVHFLENLSYKYLIKF